MPVPFGISVGDCIAVSILIKDAIKAIDSIHGSASEYQSVIRELWALDRALLEVVSLAESFETTVELNALSHTARRIAEQCRVCIVRFLDKIRKYEGSLREGGTRNKVRDGWKKVTWGLGMKGDLESFRAEVNAFCSAINMLLITASVSLTKLNDKNLGKRMEDANRSQESTAGEQMVILGQMKVAIDKHTSALQVQQRTTTSLAERMKYLLTLGTELKSFMTRIWTLSFQSYKILIELQTRVPPEFEPCWIQEPLILTDALGRTAPLHLELINNWDVLEAVLDARFKNLPGESKVKQREYALQDRISNRDVKRNDTFESSFLPGRKLDMSIVFTKRISSGNSCPSCKMESNEATSETRICSGCGMWFQRIEEIVEDPVVELQHASQTRPFNTSLYASADPDQEEAIVLESSIPCSSRKRKSSVVIVEDDISLFKRVRLLQRKYVGKVGSLHPGQNQPSVYAWQISTKLKAPSTYVDNLMFQVIHTQRHLSVTKSLTGDEIIGPSVPSVYMLFNQPGPSTRNPSTLTEMMECYATLLSARGFCLIPEKLSSFMCMYRFVQWQISPSYEAYQALHNWQVPEPSQLTIPHPAWMDLPPWGSFRDRVVRNQERYDNVEFQYDYATNLSVNFPHDPMKALVFKDGQIVISPMLETHLSDISNMSMQKPFAVKYPELHDLQHVRPNLAAWPKPVLYTYTKRFKTNDAMLQHQRDSPRHIDTPQVPQRTLNPHELVQRLSLQDEETNHCFIPFSGGGLTTPFAVPSLVPEQVTAGEIDVAKGTKKKRKKTGKGNILKMGPGGGST
ncbi:uncharacterized protein BP5553_09263 [Venustampulla echinocandica]|uniref:Ubiquitin-like domain-containing protein n=1 Tax=Venustampulla echinocandica TaxID=2656787 RepID=A0A370TC91_9HELO|nr:uncharacterized protein BP5553_09263 [Venustampulla echinocandica]RDL31861.1 hypothetical protein BP5553_09263 [Venustampulla echinocandica]